MTSGKKERVKEAMGGWGGRRRGLHYEKVVEGEVFTVIWRRGWATSPPPACLTNSAGVRKVPWHTQTMLTSSPFLNLYKNPSTRRPLGPHPVVDTYGISPTTLLPTSLPADSSPAGHNDAPAALVGDWTLVGVVASLPPVFLPAVK